MAVQNASLTIERLTCRVTVAAGAANPGVIRDTVERIAARDLAAALNTLDLPLEADSEAVYRVRNVRMRLWLDPGAEPSAQIVGRWSHVLAAAVVQVLESNDPARVVRFESPQMFVLNFLRDLIDGHAWQRWYYDEFAVLRVLSDELAALEILVQRPGWIVPLMRALMASGHGERLLARWGADALARLWAALGLAFAPPSSGELDRQLDRLAPVWRQVALSTGADEDARARDAFRLWLAAPTQDAASLSAAMMLVDLAVLMRFAPESAGLLMMQSAFFPRVADRVRAGMPDIARWVLALQADEDGRRRLAKAAELAGQRSSGAKQQAALSSPVGSVLLLLAALRSVDVWRLWSEDEAGRYLFVLALKALGRDRAPLYLSDPLITLFAGLDEPPIADARLPREPDTGTPPWARELPRLAESIYPAHTRRVTAGRARGIDVLVDQRAGHWLAARVAADNPNVGWPEDLSPTDPMGDTSLARLDADAAHLQLGQRLGYPWLTPSLDAALSAVTSLVLRRFAALLPQFGTSSPAYLAAQFLAHPASLTVRADHWVVRVDGGPLRLVLSMAGIPEHVRVPWLPLPVVFTFAGREN